MMSGRGRSLKLEHVSKRFVREGQAAVAAVDDVTIGVEPGELVTLLGPSGCGKTTTLRMVAGFERPDAGRIYIGGGEGSPPLGCCRRTCAFFPEPCRCSPPPRFSERRRIPRAGRAP